MLFIFVCNDVYPLNSISISIFIFIFSSVDFVYLLWCICVGKSMHQTIDGCGKDEKKATIMHKNRAPECNWTALRVNKCKRLSRDCWVLCINIFQWNALAGFELHWTDLISVRVYVYVWEWNEKFNSICLWFSARTHQLHSM